MDNLMSLGITIFGLSVILIIAGFICLIISAIASSDKIGKVSMLMLLVGALGMVASFSLCTMGGRHGNQL